MFLPLIGCHDDGRKRLILFVCPKTDYYHIVCVWGGWEVGVEWGGGGDPLSH